MVQGETTIADWLPQRAALTPDRVAVEFEGGSLTYRELAIRATRIRAALAALGLRPGDRIATLSQNSPDQIALLFACAASRLVMVPLNWRLAAPELEFQLRDCGATLLLSGSELEEASQAAASGPEVRVLLLSDLEAAPSRLVTTPPPRGSDPLLIIYTSGTTGTPKGAVLTQSNCFWTNLSLDRTAELAGSDVVLQVLPQSHVGGWNVQPLQAIWHGARLLLEPRFDAGRVLALIAERRVTTMMGVPTNYLFLSEHPAFGATDLTSLRMVVVGGAAMPRGLLELWLDRGVTVLQGYGLTEASPNVLCVPPEYSRTKVGSAGRPYLHVEVALARAHVEDLDPPLLDGPGRGELLVRGPNVFQGYWGRPDATAAALSQGWLHTGDLAERDQDGFYWLLGRLSEMYISGGENVYPAEVEQVLASHPQVAEAVVVGVPDSRWGEVGVAFVIPKEGAEIDAQQLVRFVRERLAGFKVPKEVMVVAELPRATEGGKVRRSALRERWEEAQGGGG